jgi:EpsI family protein
MKASVVIWLPAAILALGCALVQGVQPQQRVELRQPLERVIPASIEGFQATDIVISDEEQQVAGMTDYLMRVYRGESDAAFTLYVGYYDSQLEGNGIHSPKNCLPGAGWESLSATITTVTVAGKDFPANQYIVRRESQQALVLYWYQGRGRVGANEVKTAFNLWRDAAFYGRTEEALVRIVVPITPKEDGTALAKRVAATVIPLVGEALPELH